ncbi:hypothetical protein K0B03_04350 [Patescibacteria group bacterium]|nr:hypothetical protein [Patescibacteria group bacterium]
MISRSIIKKISNLLILISIGFPKILMAMELEKFDKDIVVVLNDATRILLSFASGIILLFLIGSGVLYIISGSNPENSEKAKKLITYTLLGAILILLSYAVITAIERIAALP